MSDWDLDRTVAQGSYGQVSLATYKRNRDVQVAIKRYRITEDAESEEKSELRIHQRLCGGTSTSPNFCRTLPTTVTCTSSSSTRSAGLCAT